MSKVLPPDFGPTHRLQKEYEAGIRKITQRVLAPKLPEQTLDEWLASIAARSQAEDVRQATETLAERMVRWVNAGNQKTWRVAAARSQQSRKLYRLLEKEMQGTTGEAVRHIIQQNAQLISSIPFESAQKLVDEVTKAQQRGARPSTISKMMRQRFPKLVRSRVQLISRTEVSKASSALTQARSEELDLPCYIWETSRDGDRVRPSHRNMQGVVCFWKDPPAPEALIGVKSTLGAYSVGDCPNDRCTPIVVLTLSDIQWPARVAYGGSIHRMTKPEFKARFASLSSGIEDERAA